MASSLDGLSIVVPQFGFATREGEIGTVRMSLRMDPIYRLHKVASSRWRLGMEGIPADEL
jgi:hypothetical protein